MENLLQPAESVTLLHATCWIVIGPEMSGDKIVGAKVRKMTLNFPTLRADEFAIKVTFKVDPSRFAEWYAKSVVVVPEGT